MVAIAVLLPYIDRMDHPHFVAVGWAVTSLVHHIEAVSLGYGELFFAVKVWWEVHLSVDVIRRHLHLLTFLFHRELCTFYQLASRAHGRL